MLCLRIWTFLVSEHLKRICTLLPDSVNDSYVCEAMDWDSCVLQLSTGTGCCQRMLKSSSYNRDVFSIFYIFLSFAFFLGFLVSVFLPSCGFLECIFEFHFDLSIMCMSLSLLPAWVTYRTLIFFFCFLTFSHVLILSSTCIKFLLKLGKIISKTQVRGESVVLTDLSFILLSFLVFHIF